MAKQNILNNLHMVLRMFSSVARLVFVITSRFSAFREKQRIRRITSNPFSDGFSNFWIIWISFGSLITNLKTDFRSLIVKICKNVQIFTIIGYENWCIWKFHVELIFLYPLRTKNEWIEPQTNLLCITTEQSWRFEVSHYGFDAIEIYVLRNWKGRWQRSDAVHRSETLWL